MKKEITFFIGAVLLILLVGYANTVFLLAFSAVLLAIFLHTLGSGTQKITKLPYPLALLLALVVIFGFFTLTFWLYSPLIADQFELLMNQLPQAIESVRSQFSSYFGVDLSQQRLQSELALPNGKLITNLLSIFSSTIGTITSVIVFIIVGLYLALDPNRYTDWLLAIVPKTKQKKIYGLLGYIGSSLRWWLLGKVFSMALVGITTFIGLNLLNVSLALILGFLAGLLTFIPYVGSIIAAIPAILIGFAQSPLKALYVTILYIGIHLVDGYLITPYIEQRTVSIPPAITIMTQVLMVVLVGGIGLALATPLAVVFIALIQTRLHQREKVTL